MIHALAILFFLIGSALHSLAQIDAIARSKNNPNNSRVGILESRWQTILIRTAWSMAIFILWLQGQLVAVVTAIKIPLPDSLAGVLDLHVSGPVAFMAGYLFDSALAFIPGLKNSVPPSLDASDGNPPPKVDSIPPKV